MNLGWVGSRAVATLSLLALTATLAGCSSTFTGTSGEPIATEGASYTDGDPRRLAEPSPSADAEPGGAVFMGAEGVGVTLAVPEGWVDVTADYLAEHPDEDFAAVWTLGGSLDDGVNVAKIVTTYVDLDQNPRYGVYSSLTAKAEELTDPVLTADSSIAARDGASGWLASARGTKGGENVTVATAVVSHYEYQLQALFELYTDADESVDLLVGSLVDVAFVAPTPVEGRHGAPEDEDGRWYSYCRLLSIDVDDQASYDFTPRFDSTPWACPESTDYLGSFLFWAGDDSLSVQLIYMVDSTMAEARAYKGLPDAVGVPVTSDEGFTVELLWEETVTMPDGQVGSMHGVRVTDAEGTIYRVGYLLPIGNGVVDVVVGSDYDTQDFRTDWLTPWLTTIETEA